MKSSPCEAAVPVRQPWYGSPLSSIIMVSHYIFLPSAHSDRWHSLLSCHLLFPPTVYGQCTRHILGSGFSWSRNLEPNFSYGPQPLGWHSSILTARPLCTHTKPDKQVGSVFCQSNTTRRERSRSSIIQGRPPPLSQ